MVKKIFGQCYIWLILILMYLPILVLIAFSFTKSVNVGVWKGFSFDLYSDLFRSKEILTALANTLIIAITSALVATILGTLGAIGAFYSSKKFRRAYEFVNQIPVVNAEIVMALSLAIMFAALPSLIFHTDLRSYWTLLIGHVVLGAPFVYINVKPKLQQMDPSLYEAAIDLGAKPRQALWKVTLPEILPGVFSGFLLAITLSLDDFVISQFTTGPGLLSAGDPKIVTLSILIQDKIKKGPIPPAMRALTTVIFLLVVLGVVGITVFRHYKSKKAALASKANRKRRRAY
ncbi:MAG: ABC transporter permease [Bacilli bacterium]|nr:ABC transporter permease [Bacilli bacterium]